MQWNILLTRIYKKKTDRRKTILKPDKRMGNWSRGQTFRVLAYRHLFISDHVFSILRIADMFESDDCLEMNFLWTVCGRLLIMVQEAISKSGRSNSLKCAGNINLEKYVSIPSVENGRFKKVLSASHRHVCLPSWIRLHMSDSIWIGETIKWENVE